MRITAGVLVLVFGAGPATAQDTVRVRFAPRAGVQFSTVTTIRTVIIASGLPAVPDGSQFETERQIFASQEIAGPADRGWRVQVAVDSARVRSRAAGGRWRQLPPSPLEGQQAVAVVGPRFDVAGIETSGPHDAEVLRVLTGWMAGLGFAFPATTVRPGIAFETGGRLRFDAVLDADSSMPVREGLFGDLGLRLDSVQVRAGDSLLHFSFTGSFAPHHVQAVSESEDVSGAYGGAFAGRLIWSTGWNAFVSAAARVRAEGRVTGPADIRIEWDATVSHRVRP